MSVTRYTLIDKIGIITLNNPPVNALSHALREGITEAVNNAQNDESKALIIICEGRTFCAGADISEFGKPMRAPLLTDVITTIESSNKPIIAAIHGTALGGGLEVALACHYRCAVAGAMMGLPEVKLGLLPGAGGTQRTPRLVGVEAALDMITSGNPINAQKALDLKLIDQLIEADLQSGAVAFAQQIVEQGAATPRVRDISINPATLPADIFDKARQSLRKRARGQQAPQRIVDCIEAAVHTDMAEGLQKERDEFVACMNSAQSAGMRHLFFSQRNAAKVNGLAKDTTLRPINTVAVIGAGTMGGGIAMNFANAGIAVKLLELNKEALERGLGIIDKNYSITVSKGKLSEQQKQQCLSLITGTTDYRDLSDADLVIEAVFENLDIKKQVFSKLDEVCKQGAILATNTSYQDVNAIADVTSRPQDVVGLHFFSPANVMKLLEVVRGAKSADDVIATAMKLATTIKKIPVLAGVCFGFIGNRMLSAYIRQSQLCLIEGATPEQIDSTMENWGAAMGPLAVSDLAGIDIGYKAREGLTSEQKGAPETYCIADAMYHAGRLGQKTGAGYYTYDAQTRARSNDPEAIAIIEAQSKDRNIERRTIGEQEIHDRLIFALVNEGAKVLEDGIAQRASDIDVVYIFGYGFPAYRGGPMHYADSLGLKNVYKTICDMRDKFGGTYWTPSELLKSLAEQGKSFSDWDAEQNA